MSNWLVSTFDNLATKVEADAEELAAKTVEALLPNLAADLTPIVENAVDSALGNVPFSSVITPDVNAAVSKLVAELVSAIEAALPV
jgi:hypothetical protein